MNTRQRTGIALPSRCDSRCWLGDPSRPFRVVVDPTRRNGMVLIVVTVVLLLISVAIVGLVSLMFTELRSTKLRGDEMKLENLQASAETYLKVITIKPRQQRTLSANSGSTSNSFRHQPLLAGNTGADDGFVSVLQLGPLVATDGQHRFGLTNESSKLNLQSLLVWERAHPGLGESALLQLPGMTPQAAATILDFIDADSQPRPLGAESGQAESVSTASPPNCVPSFLEELLMVRGVTRADLFADAKFQQTDVPSPRSATKSKSIDRRGRVESAMPGMNPHAPWSDFLTANSGERNESAAGEPRVFLNGSDLRDLHNRLSARLDQSWADFVVLYRQFGPAKTSAGRKRSNASSHSSADRGWGTPEIDFSIPPRFVLDCELDLVGARVAVPSRGTTMQLIDSPLAKDGIGWGGELSRVMDLITVERASVIDGRINIDEAPREVLMALPEMDPATVDRILAARLLSVDGRTSHAHATWLMEQGILDHASMAKLLPYVTTGGDVFQARVLCYFMDRPGAIWEEVAIDATDPTHVRLYCKDLRDTPLPLSPGQLAPVQNTSQLQSR